MTKKKSILIILIIIILVLIALFIFYLLYSKQSGVGVDFPEPPGEGETDFPPTGGEIDPDTGLPPEIIMGGTEPPDRYSNYPQAYNRLKRISSLPVAGTIVFEKDSDILIRYVERGSGDLFETKAVTAESPYRIARTGIQKIYEAYWAKKGQSVVLRYLKQGSDDVQNMHLSLEGASGGGEQTLSGGAFLSPSISAMTVSPSTEKIFYILKSVDYSYGIIANPDGTQRVQVFESPLTEWQPLWQDPNKVILFTKPSADVAGFAYEINTQTGKWERILGGMAGLMLMPNNDSSAMLYFRNKADSQELGVFYPSNNTVSVINAKTLPEKCTWSKLDNEIIFCAVGRSSFLINEPDNWYMGLTSFRDRVWKINTETGETVLIFDPEILVQTQMDVIDLRLDPEENYLVFQNRNDLSLWLYELE